MTTRLNHAGSSFHGIQESATSSLQVKCIRILQSQFVTKNRSSRREMIVRSCSSYNHAVNRSRIRVRFLHQLLGSLTGQIWSSQTFFVQDTSFFHPDTSHNPLIIGVNHSRQFFVCQDIIRYISTDSCNYSIYFFHHFLISWLIKKQPKSRNGSPALISLEHAKMFYKASSY